MIDGGGLTRSPGYLLAVLAIWQAARFYRTRSRGSALATGILAGLTLLTHPEGALFGIVSVVVIFVFVGAELEIAARVARHVRPRRRRLGAVVGRRAAPVRPGPAALGRPDGARRPRQPAVRADLDVHGRAVHGVPGGDRAPGRPVLRDPPSLAAPGLGRRHLRDRSAGRPAVLDGAPGDAGRDRNPGGDPRDDPAVPAPARTSPCGPDPSCAIASGGWSWPSRSSWASWRRSRSPSRPTIRCMPCRRRTATRWRGWRSTPRPTRNSPW